MKKFSMLVIIAIGFVGIAALLAPQTNLLLGNSTTEGPFLDAPANRGNEIYEVATEPVRQVAQDDSFEPIAEDDPFSSNNDPVPQKQTGDDFDTEPTSDGYRRSSKNEDEFSSGNDSFGSPTNPPAATQNQVSDFNPPTRGTPAEPSTEPIRDAPGDSSFRRQSQPEPANQTFNTYQGSPTYPPSNSDRKVQQWQARIQQYIRQLHQIDDPEKRKPILSQIKNLLNTYFQHDLKTRSQAIDQLEARVKKLRSQVEKRRKSGQKILDLQMQLIINEADGLGFMSMPLTTQPGWALPPSPYNTQSGSGNNSTWNELPSYPDNNLNVEPGNNSTWNESVPSPYAPIDDAPAQSEDGFSDPRLDNDDFGAPDSKKKIVPESGGEESGFDDGFRDDFGSNDGP